MNPLQRALVEKCGNDNGFEHVVDSSSNGVTLASARHSVLANVSMAGSAYLVRLPARSQTLQSEIDRSLPGSRSGPDQFLSQSEAGLAALLRRAASLARALPSQAATDYQQAVEAELSALPAGLAGTEVERLVRQRVGQDKFRNAMLDYWGGACAVTGVAIPAVLRASHAKPWAECVSDAERLDVFNGFLLNANLDALFDRFLISFDDEGTLVVASALKITDLVPLGVMSGMKLRWLNQLHRPYLAYHRARWASLSATANIETIVSTP
jgi:putative restriction endonuclease